MKYSFAPLLCLCLVFVVIAGYGVLSIHTTQSFADSNTTTETNSLTSQDMPILQAPLNSGSARVLDASTSSPDLPPVIDPDLSVSDTVATTTIYTIESGDSLWSLARQYGVTVNDLKTINNLTSNSIRPGQKITIPK